MLEAGLNSEVEPGAISARLAAADDLSEHEKSLASHCVGFNTEGSLREAPGVNPLYIARALVITRTLSGLTVICMPTRKKAESPAKRPARLPNGAPLVYAPDNEQGLVYLFSHLARKRFVYTLNGFRRASLIASPTKAASGLKRWKCGYQLTS